MVRLFYTEVKHGGKANHAARLHDAAHEMLRQCVLSCMTGITGQQPKAVRMELGFGPHGKPFLKSHPAFNVSLSHAGNIALCAISEAEIGADVQDHRELAADYLLRIAERFFTPPEKEALEKLRGEAQRVLFYRIWAAKESYAKLTGKGMAEDFTTFLADFDAMCIRRFPFDQKNTASGFLQEPLVLPGYSILLSTEAPAADAEVVQASIPAITGVGKPV